jgi:heme/copper-type cytochrome/quinol oxidase subunit 3
MMDARPLAMVYLPGPTIWPFMLAVSFVFLFAGALIDSLPLASIGAAIAAVSLAGWFWPSASQTLAIREMGTGHGAGSLPLAVYGPLSNGWWGTLVAVLVLAVALASLLASYFYLAPRSTAGEADLTETLLAGSGVPVALALGAAAWWGSRHPSPGDLARRQLGLAVGFLLGLTLLGLLALLYRYRETQFTRALDADGSLFFILIVFQTLATALAVIMLTVGQLWAWRAPSDPRGLAAAANAVPVSWFVGASWLLVFATLYLFPLAR